MRHRMNKQGAIFTGHGVSLVIRSNLVAEERTPLFTSVGLDTGRFCFEGLLN
jgi:hypothetical protein